MQKRFVPGTFLYMYRRKSRHNKIVPKHVSSIQNATMRVRETRRTSPSIRNLYNRVLFLFHTVRDEEYDTSLQLLSLSL